MARRHQTAVAVQRLGQVTKAAAPHRPRPGRRMSIGQEPVGVQVGGIAHGVLGAEGQ